MMLVTHDIHEFAGRDQNESPLPDEAAVTSPRNYYEVLGLSPREANVEAIRLATEQRRAQLQAARQHLAANMWEHLATELETAAATLLNPQSKQTYDQQMFTGVRAHREPHPVAAPQVQPQSRPCPRCAWNNLPDREFCGGCGVALWEPCLACGTEVGIWEKFCGTCGSNLAATFQERSVELRQKEQHALALAREGRPREALALYSEVAAVSHPRLEEVHARCQRAVEQLAAKLEQVNRSLAAREQEARDAFERHDYARVSEILGTLKLDPQRTDLLQLWEESERRVREIGRLWREIREQWQREPKDLTALRQHASQLQALCPSDAKLRQLHERLEKAARQRQSRLQQKALQHAKKYLETQDYASALAELSTVEETARDDRWRESQQRAENLSREVEWLKQDLKSAVWDEHATRLAERLEKLCSRKPAVVAQVQKLRLHLQQREKQGLNFWSGKTLESPGLGSALELPRVFPRIELAPEVRQDRTCMSNLGSFAIALGMGLQGLGTAACRVNLLPVTRKKWWDLSGSPRKDISGRSAWGVDLGSSALKAVLLSWDGEEDLPYWEQAVLLEGEGGVARDARALETYQRKLVARFLEEHDPEETEVFGLSIPGQELLLRSFRIPAKARGKQRDELLRHEVAAQIPFPMEHIVWDHQFLTDEESVVPESRDCEVQVLACKKATVSQARDLWAAHEVDIHLFQNEAVALHNLLTHSYLDSEQPGGLDAQGILDVGDRASNLVVTQGAKFWHRTLNFGGAEIQAELVRSLQVTQEQAERLVRDPASGEWVYRVYEACQPAFGKLRGELARSLGYVAHQIGGKAPRRIICTGNGLRMHGLFPALAES